MVEFRAKHSPYNVKIISHAEENIYMPHIARQCYAVMNNWLYKLHHLCRYKVHATSHLCIRDRNMCIRQQLVTHQDIVLSNPTKTTLRNWRIFLPFLLKLCNDVLLQYFRCKVKSSHVARSILRMSYLESFKRRAQSTYILHLDYFHEENDT